MDRKIRVCSLGSGSAGNAIVIESGAHSILVDAGFSRKVLLERLQMRNFAPGNIMSVLLTHDHDDHAKGGRVLCNQLDIPLYASPGTADYLAKQGKLPDTVVHFEIGSSFEIGEFFIHPFSVQHDAQETVGFTVSVGGLKIGIATDLGRINPMIKRHLNNCDLLILESNYDKEMLLNSDRPPHLKRRIMSAIGHLDNLDAMEALSELLGERTRHLCLGHVSRECNEYRLVRDLAAERLRQLRFEHVDLHVLEQDTPGLVFEFGAELLL